MSIFRDRPVHTHGGSGYLYIAERIPELKNTLQFIRFSGFSDEKKTTILNLLANLHSRREEIKSNPDSTLKIEYLDQFLESLPKTEEEAITFVYHNHPSRPPQVDRKNRYVWHNPDWISTRSFIDAYGKPHQATEARVLIHEMVHLLLNKEDNYTYRATQSKGFDPAGDTVRWTNAILYSNDEAYKSVGEKLRLSYMGWIKNEDLPENMSSGYINSSRAYINSSNPLKSVDNIIVSYGKGGRGIEFQTNINAKIFKKDNGKSPKNLIIGANPNKKYRLEGADKNDYFYGNKKDDVLIGGRSDDLLIGGAGHDILSAESKLPVQAIQQAMTAPWYSPDDVIDRVVEPNRKDADVFMGGPGNDLIIGNYRGEEQYIASKDSPSIDIAIYRGKRCDYELGGSSSDDLNYIEVRDLRDKNSDGSDQLWDIEALKFEDQTYYINGQYNKPCPTTRAPRLCGSARKNYFKQHSDDQNVAFFESEYAFKAITKGRSTNKLIIEKTDYSYSATMPAGSRGKIKGKIKFEFENYTIIKELNLSPVLPEPAQMCGDFLCPPRAIMRRRDNCMPEDSTDFDPLTSLE